MKIWRVYVYKDDGHPTPPITDEMWYDEDGDMHSEDVEYQVMGMLGFPDDKYATAYEVTHQFRQL